MRRGLRLLVAMAGFGIASGGGAYLFATSAPELAPVDAGSLVFSAEEIGRGELLAMVGDCSACHTAPNGAVNAGGFGLPTPFGTIYSTNITPDPSTGIGLWSLEAFSRAMREGLDREGRHLYPAFPYDSFTKTRDDDLRALYAYLMSQPPVVAEERPNDLLFPFSFRPLLAGWKLLFLDRTPFEPDPSLDDEQNHGAYLAASLGHCGACHSPRNAFGAVIAERALEGGEAEGWNAPPLGPYSIAPVHWTLDDYADYLFDGWSEAHGIAAGPMTPVADHLYEADEDDVFAIAAWLAVITSEQSEEEREQVVAAAAARDWPLSEGVVFDQVLPDPDLETGRDIFAARCAKCHKERIGSKQPVSLALSYAVNAPSARNFVNVVKGGIVPPQGVADRKMDAVSLSQDELIAVARYVRWHFVGKPAWEDVGQLAEEWQTGSGH